MKFYSGLLILLLFCSCISDISDYGSYKFDYDSKVDHYIMLNKIDTVIQDYPYYNKGAFVYFHRADSTVDTFFMGKGGDVVQPYVDDVRFNDRFILVKQKPLDKICECNDSCLAIKYPDNEKTYPLCSDALKKSTFFNYWIIDQSNDNIYGPYDRQTFSKQLNVLKVPETIRF